MLRGESFPLQLLRKAARVTWIANCRRNDWLVVSRNGEFLASLFDLEARHLTDCETTRARLKCEAGHCLPNIMESMAIRFARGSKSQAGDG